MGEHQNYIALQRQKDPVAWALAPRGSAGCWARESLRHREGIPVKGPGACQNSICLPLRSLASSHGSACTWRQGNPQTQPSRRC